MTTLIFMIGLILTILGIAAAFLKSSIRTEDVTGKNRFDEVVIKEHKSPAPLLLIASNFGKAISVGVLLMFLSTTLQYARPGHKYYVVTPFGSEYVISSQGYKIMVPFSRVQEWEQYIDIKTTAGGDALEGIEGQINDFTMYDKIDANGKIVKGKSIKAIGIPMRFNDKVKANCKISVRVQLPVGDEDFIALVKSYRHPQNLINNTLIPTIKEQTINTAYMFSAEDYVSGEASNFRQALDDQLKNGGFAVDKIETEDTSDVTIQIDGDRMIKRTETKIEVVKRKDKNGKFIRIPHDIKANKLLISQVIVDKVVTEPRFQYKLEKQRDLSAQKSIEYQLTENAKIEQSRITAQGERDKETERVTQEKAQVSVLIALETKLKGEETNKKLAKIQLETEKIRSATVRVKQDAIAYANKKLSLAGLTPQEKLAGDIKMADVVSKNMAGPNGIKFPTYYTSGGGASSSKSSQDPLAKMMEMMMATQMLNQKK